MNISQSIKGIALAAAVVAGGGVASEVNAQVAPTATGGNVYVGGTMGSTVGNISAVGVSDTTANNSTIGAENFVSATNTFNNSASTITGGGFASLGNATVLNSQARGYVAAAATDAAALDSSALGNLNVVGVNSSISKDNFLVNSAGSSILGTTYVSNSRTGSDVVSAAAQGSVLTASAAGQINTVNTTNGYYNTAYNITGAAAKSLGNTVILDSNVGRSGTAFSVTGSALTGTAAGSGNVAQPNSPVVKNNYNFTITPGL